MLWKCCGLLITSNLWREHMMWSALWMLERVSQNSDEEHSVFFVVTKLWSYSAAPPRRRLSVLEYLSHPVCWISSRHHEKCSHECVLELGDLHQHILTLFWLGLIDPLGVVLNQAVSKSKAPQNVTLSSTLVCMQTCHTFLHPCVDATSWICPF